MITSAKRKNVSSTLKLVLALVSRKMEMSNSLASWSPLSKWTACVKKRNVRQSKRSGHSMIVHKQDDTLWSCKSALLPSRANTAPCAASTALFLHMGTLFIVPSCVMSYTRITPAAPRKDPEEETRQPSSPPGNREQEHIEMASPRLAHSHLSSTSRTDLGPLCPRSASSRWIHSRPSLSF
jgi:hypothetical protein